MYVNGICAEKRKLDQSLKTQIRFGKRDIEVFTKYKGEEAGFKKIKLCDFTDISEIPEFDWGIRWRRYQDKPPRPRIHRQEVPRQRPSMRTQMEDENPGDPAGRSQQPPQTLVRRNSNTLNSDSKKPRIEESSSSGEDEDLMEDSEESSSPARGQRV